MCVQVEQDLACGSGLAAQYEQVAELLRDHHLTDDDRYRLIWIDT